MKVIILAAGYAVRLQPLTLNTPKPLLSIAGKKIIDRILEKIDTVRDVSSIYIITNSKFFKNFGDWLKNLKRKNKIVLIDDGTLTNEDRLGAIKDLDFVLREESINDDLLIVAGDNLFDFDLNKFLRFAGSKTDGVSIAVHDVGDLKLATNYGVVKVDKNGRVLDFEEKPANPQSTLISTGIYYFPKNKLSFIKEYVKMQEKLDAPGYYIKWLVKAGNVYGFRFSEDWYDIGSIESYGKADKEYLKKESRRNGEA